jgi:hypothetical protein
MKTKPTWILMSAVLIAGLLFSGCSPSTRNPQKQEYPKYVPYGSSAPSLQNISAPAATSCPVHTVDLIGAWVTAGSSETDPFPFTDLNDASCTGMFESDILPLFTTSNLWYSGALSCRTCHGPDTAVSYVGMNLSSYQGIKAGTNGKDILGGGDWKSSDLNKFLTSGIMPPNQPPGYNSQGPVVYAGVKK